MQGQQPGETERRKENKQAGHLRSPVLATLILPRTVSAAA